MLPKLFSSSLGSYLATLTIMLGFLSQITQTKARKHVTEIFEVKTGTENGGCDNYPVDEWFAEASDLANHVKRCFDSAQKALEEGRRGGALVVMETGQTSQASALIHKG